MLIITPILQTRNLLSEATLLQKIARPPPHQGRGGHLTKYA